MSAKRVTLFLYQWQVDLLKIENEKTWGKGRELALSHFIRNIIADHIEAESKKEAQ